MNCEHEIEILDAVLDGRWPDGCDTDLRAHAAACPSCSELLAVAVPLRDDYHHAVHEADPPPAAAVWWRAQRRARYEAMQNATRTVAAVQTGLVAAAGVVGMALIGGIGAWLAHVSDGIHFGAIDVAPLTGLMMVAAVAACVLVAPVAVWLLVEE